MSLRIYARLSRSAIILSDTFDKYLSLQICKCAPLTQATSITSVSQPSPKCQTWARPSRRRAFVARRDRPDAERLGSAPSFFPPVPIPRSLKSSSVRSPVRSCRWCQFAFAILLMTLTLASMQSFAYCMAAVPRRVSFRNPLLRSPRITGAMFLALLCVAWLIFFIHHICRRSASITSSYALIAPILDFTFSNLR